MNCLHVQKSRINGTIDIPPSKSQTLRAILFASLADGESHIYRYLQSPDTMAMIQACQSLGARIEVIGAEFGLLKITGTKCITPQGIIDAGNSGIVLRFITAVAALGSQSITITGDHSIQTQRNMEPMLSALQQLGVDARALKGNGLAPLEICGPINSGRAVINGQDSQPISGLLIAMALSDRGPFELEVMDPGELPWVALTLDWFDRLGLGSTYENQDYKRYRILGGGKIDPFNYVVPGDLSSVSFPVAAAVLTGSELTMTNVTMDDKQGDKKFSDVLKRMGAEIEVSENQICVRSGCGGGLELTQAKKCLRGVSVDINDFIDAIPILAVVCSLADGESHIYNGAIARTKECNRISCTALELRKMGADVTETPDGLRIVGKGFIGGNLVGAVVDSHSDHRLAMSLAVAGMVADGETVVQGTRCIAKTYPTFIEDFQKINANFKDYGMN